MAEGGGSGVGSGWTQLFIELIPRGVSVASSEFLRPPWDGGGRADGSGKWMAATLSCVVPAGPVLVYCEFLRLSWDGGGGGTGVGSG